jgi:hypothetical protein
MEVWACYLPLVIIFISLVMKALLITSFSEEHHMKNFALRGWACGSEVDLLPSMHRALSSIPNTTKNGFCFELGTQPSLDK